jgi:hypothetical protein
MTSGNGEATSSHVDQNEPIIRKTKTMYGRYRLRVLLVAGPTGGGRALRANVQAQ